MNETSSSISAAHSTPDGTAQHTDLLDLTVVVVNYNVRDFLEHALESVDRAVSGLSVEVIVVDNDSADGSVEMVRTRFPRHTVIANRENVGFSRANNQAIRIARGRNILLLNPDTVVQEDTFREMIGFLEENPLAGAVGCKILNPDGSFAPESRRAFPTPSVAITRILGLSRLFPRSRLFGKYNLTYKPIDESTEVDALSGSCMLIRRAALAGSPNDEGDDRPLSLLFDEQFFMYGEDLDLCYRIQQAGWKLFYSPSTQIIHYKGESTKKGDLRYVRLFYGAMLRFTEKHFHGQYSFLFRSAIRAGIFVRGGISAVGRLTRRVAPVAIDFLIVFGVVACAARVRFGDLPKQILYTIAPAYALASVATLGILGAYRRTQRHRIQLLFYGVMGGLLAVATISFFFKQVAYSRAVVLASAPVSLLLMAGWRLLRRTESDGVIRAIVVGSSEEATRVATQIRAHPNPPFHLSGFVSPDQNKRSSAHIQCLGETRQLRDIVRLSKADTVVFASGSNTRRDIFGWMQELRDLPVTFRMLDTRESFVVGKSSIDQLAIGELVEADVALGIKRSSWSHRSFDVVFSVIGLLLSPIVFLGASLGSRRLRHAAGILRGLPSVLAARKAVVGYDEAADYRPPPSWGLRPGLVSVVDDRAAGLTGGHLTRTELDQAYGYYAMNQSATTDWAIVRRTLADSPETD